MEITYVSLAAVVGSGLMFFRVASVSILLLAATPAEAALSLVSKSPALQPSGDRYEVHSDALGRDMVVTVTPPLTPLPKDAKVATVYALDGGYGVAGPIGAVLAGAEAMQPVLVVAVEYPIGQWGPRSDDLLYQRSYQAGRLEGGGAPAFERFLLDELRPWVESRYPADPARAVLFGHSDAGLFAAELMARKSAAFQGYIVASPSVMKDPAVATRLKVQAPLLKGTKVYVAVGAAEAPRMRSGERALARALQGPGSAAVVRERVYAGAGHITYYPRLVVDALPWMLPPEVPAPIPSGMLARDAGAYALEDGRHAIVTRRGGQMFITLDRDTQREMFTAGPAAYSVKGTRMEVSFEGVRQGHSQSIVVRDGTDRLMGRRAP